MHTKREREGKEGRAYRSNRCVKIPQTEVRGTNLAESEARKERRITAQYCTMTRGKASLPAPTETQNVTASRLWSDIKAAAVATSATADNTGCLQGCGGVGRERPPGSCFFSTFERHPSFVMALASSPSSRYTSARFKRHRRSRWACAACRNKLTLDARLRSRNLQMKLH